MHIDFDVENNAEEFTLEFMRLRRHEVFLSFRGEDTRASITSHLYASLRNEGIKVFMDDDSLQRGDRISTSLNQAIEDSQIAVIVFSRNYADSRWCLDELVKIMECHRTIGQVVLPVFYDVDPSEVRHQTGEFGKAFQSLLNRLSNKKGIYHRVGKTVRYLLNSLSINKGESPNQVLRWSWRAALRDAAGLAGFVVLNSR
jgi:deoxyribodipyrimidine photolyase